MARPRIMTKEKVNRLCAEIKQGLPFDTAAKLAGFGPATFYRYKAQAFALINNTLDLTKYTEDEIEILQYFIDETLKAEAEGEAAMIAEIRAAAKNGRWGAAKFMLQARYGWITRTEKTVRHENLLGSGDKSMEVTRMSTAELEQLAAGEIQEGEIVEVDS